MAISERTTKLLWSRSRNQCAFPACGQELTEITSDPASGEFRALVIGEQAHIRSARSNGPRHDRQYPIADIDSYPNLILLCRNHHVRIDANSGGDFTVAELEAMRDSHERRLERQERILTTMNAFVGQQYARDDRVLFEQVDLNGPSVDALFVDVPFVCRSTSAIAPVLARIAREHPGDLDAPDLASGQVVTGAAQAILNPMWSGNALLVGGPGQGKSTLLQFVCQFHRARMLGRQQYAGDAHGLREVTDIVRVPIRVDLRDYVSWAESRSRSRTGGKPKEAKKRRARSKGRHRDWPTLEEFFAFEVARCAGQPFGIDDLASVVATMPLLVALDGLDEVADLRDRGRVSDAILDTEARLSASAINLVVLVATRPGMTSALWSTGTFPRFDLQPLSFGLQLQYLERWVKVAGLSQKGASGLRATFNAGQDLPHVKELASSPMQLAILLHLLHRRGLLPQRRTELFAEYMKTFLDREQSDDKEPLLAEERTVIEAVHCYIGWFIHTRTEQGLSSGSITLQDLKSVLREQLADDEDRLLLADRIFSAMTTRVLCLVEREPGTIQFEVQSLREYFCAKYMFDQARKSKRDDCLRAMLRRPYWSNVCRFYVGMLVPAEVRDIRYQLVQLSNSKSAGAHPLLRSMAAVLLKDRVYDGEKDAPIQDVVDFIFAGPGVVLAEAGLVDPSGSALTLAERAGRAQAVTHLKERLQSEADSETRRALSCSLARHASPSDSLADWWWSQIDSAPSWLDVAAKLQLLSSMTAMQETDLVSSLERYSSPIGWATSKLIEGRYEGHRAEVLEIVRAELNDGALYEASRQARPSTIHELAAHALAAAETSPIPGVTSTAAVGPVRAGRGHVPSWLDALFDEGAELAKAPATTSDSAARLLKVASLWGNGWISRRAASALPHDTDFDVLDARLRDAEPWLRDVVSFVRGSRENRNSSEWWAEARTTANDAIATATWVIALLSGAHLEAVVNLAVDLDLAVSQMSPRHVRAVSSAIQRDQAKGCRSLFLNDVMRRNKLQLSPRALWLIRQVSTQFAIPQVDKMIAARVADLMSDPLGDLRPVVSSACEGKTVPAAAFRGSRATMSGGEWRGDLKIGAITSKASQEILARPSDWPDDLLHAAAEALERRTIDRLESVGGLAASEGWF